MPEEPALHRIFGHQELWSWSQTTYVSSRPTCWIGLILQRSSKCPEWWKSQRKVIHIISSTELSSANLMQIW